MLGSGGTCPFLTHNLNFSNNNRLISNYKDNPMKNKASTNEQILRATKEIIVKFIEVGRVSPTGFNESFKSVYNTIYQSVIDAEINQEQIQSEGPE